jgi:metal-responsive CopG/Arc/MetJ family transcriptional regulator
MPRLMVLIPADMLAAIDEHRRTEPDIPPRTEAIRRLIRAGLDGAARRVPMGRSPGQAMKRPGGVGRARGGA